MIIETFDNGVMKINTKGKDIRQYIIVGRTDTGEIMLGPADNTDVLDMIRGFRGDIIAAVDPVASRGGLAIVTAGMTSANIK